MAINFHQTNPIYLSHRFPHGFSENSARMGIPNLRQKLFLSNEALPLHASWAEPWALRRPPKDGEDEEILGR
jgi:hypothetical protein